MQMMTLIVLSLLLLIPCTSTTLADERPRIRDLGVSPGILPPGRHNAITDVQGVKVGHQTIIRGESVRTGV